MEVIQNQFRKSRSQMFFKISILKFPKIHWKTPVLQSLFQESQACNFIKKETLAQVYFLRILRNFKNIYLEEHLQTAAESRIHFENGKARDRKNTVFRQLLKIIVFL